MTRSNAIDGASTFATLRVWNEQTFSYWEMVICARNIDARDRFLALHTPPMVFVRNVRLDPYPPITPTNRGHANAEHQDDRQPLG